MTSWTQNRLLMTLVFIGFALVSIAMVAFGDRSAKWLGLAALAMFGGSGAAWFMGEFRSARAAPPRLDTLRLPSGTSSPALVLPITAGKQRSAVLAQASFATGSLIFALSPESLGDRDGPIVRVIFLVVGVFLAITASRSFWGWARREFFVALTPTGLLVQTIAGGNFLPWRAVAGIHVFPSYGQPFLGIDVTSRDAIQGEGVLRPVERLERRLTGRDLSVWLGGFAASPEAVERLIRDYYEFPERRARLGHDPVPAVLLRPGEPAATRAITDNEKRHARSVGRWIGVLLLGLYGVFVCAIAVGAIERLAAASPASSSDMPRAPVAVAVSFVLAAIVFLVGLVHLGAATAIIRRHETGRRVGFALSAIGIGIGGISVLVILLTDLRHEPRLWGLAGFVLGAYSLLMLVLFLVGNLSELRSPSDDDPTPPQNALLASSGSTGASDRGLPGP